MSHQIIEGESCHFLDRVHSLAGWLCYHCLGSGDGPAAAAGIWGACFHGIPKAHYILSSTTLPPPPPRRPVQAPATQSTLYPGQFESNPADTAPAIPPRPGLKPPLPRRPARLSFPPDPDGPQTEPEFDGESAPTKALALDSPQSRQKPSLYTSPRESQSSFGRSSTSSSNSLSRTPSASEGSGPLPPVPRRFMSPSTPL